MHISRTEDYGKRFTENEVLNRVSSDDLTIFGYVSVSYLANETKYFIAQIKFLYINAIVSNHL